MKHTECKNCKLGEGDCGYHFNNDGHIHYDIPSLSVCDKYGFCEFFQPKPKIKSKRPQGECRTCKYRDPEDKKCDCGELERQGCIFPVSDDYYCKYYERGENNGRK